VVVCHHVGATIVVVWHCICVKLVHEHSQQDSKSIGCIFTSIKSYETSAISSPLLLLTKVDRDQ